MLKSMTAYSRSTIEAPLGRLVVEIQSVNGKFLELKTYLPTELARFEGMVKEILRKNLARGQVIVKIFAFFEEQTPFILRPNLALARQMKTAWDAITCDLGLSQDGQAYLHMLSQQEGLFLQEENINSEEAFRQQIVDGVELALKNLIQMKEREGQALFEDISSRVEHLKQWIEQIAVKVPQATSRYRQKLLAKLQEVLQGSLDNEEKVLREVAIYAERIDIAEEITRFRSHVSQLSSLLIADKGPVGKTLEFLLQELNREINTIGSKSSDVEVSHLVVEMKSEFERIREQIQNIE